MYATGRVIQPTSRQPDQADHARIQKVSSGRGGGGKGGSRSKFSQRYFFFSFFL